MNTRRLALVALLAAASARELPSQVARGATDVGRARGLPSSGRYTPPPDRRPARFPDRWGLPAGRAPVVARNAMVVSDAPTGENGSLEETWKAVSLPDGMRIVEPFLLPQDLIFRSNGAIIGGSVSRIVLEDTADHRILTLEISMMGTVQLY